MYQNTHVYFSNKKKRNTHVYFSKKKKGIHMSTYKINVQIYLLQGTLWEIFWPFIEALRVIRGFDQSYPRQEKRRSNPKNKAWFLWRNLDVGCFVCLVYMIGEVILQVNRTTLYLIINMYRLYYFKKTCIDYKRCFFHNIFKCSSFNFYTYV